MKKVTDIIVEFLISKGVTDAFGYPGGVICHLLDSFSKYDEIAAHLMYHEQAAAFAACGYAQESKNIGVAYATSGPGATNLVTGIANAYFDSIPTIFFTGQVDTYALKGTLPIRQRGFQETNIVDITRSITKYAVCLDDPLKIIYELEKAYIKAIGGNPGPVLIDLPADVQRAMVDETKLVHFDKEQKGTKEVNIDSVICALKKAKRPCFLVGNGVKQAGARDKFRTLVSFMKVPCVFSMPAFDILPNNHSQNYGFIGANGHRYANYVLSKADIIITLGSRLDMKQTNLNKKSFVPNAKIYRVDIDEANFMNYVHTDDVNICADINDVIDELLSVKSMLPKVSEEWNYTCRKIKKLLLNYDICDYTRRISNLSKHIPDGSVITADVGQSEVWIAQYFMVKNDQTVHMSCGLGTMGYSLPAAIGAYYASKKPVYCFNGDGGIQMNIQELMFIQREKIPVSVIIINNASLGMIRGFQEANFAKRYIHTTETSGYLAPDFENVAKTYNLGYVLLDDETMNEEIEANPQLIEIRICSETILAPNFGKEGLIERQNPPIDNNLVSLLK